MKNKLIYIVGTLGLLTVSLSSCYSDKSQPPLEYFPDMYYSVPYEPLTKAQDPYTDHINQVPIFKSRGGQTGLKPVEGTIAQNRDGVLPGETPSSTPEYNALYAKSLLVTQSPLDPKNREKDLARGKKLFDQLCAVCHGLHGDGQGPIVKSGAYSGVPKYKDRDITVGSVHFVLVNGRNNMGSYAGQLTPGDRWRVAMYVMDAFKSDPLKKIQEENKEEEQAKTETATAEQDNANTQK